MQTIYTLRAIGLLIVGFLVAVPAQARQDEKTKTVTVEVRDGKVFINGAEADSAAVARMHRDGEMEVQIDDDNVWIMRGAPQAGNRWHMDDCEDCEPQVFRFRGDAPGMGLHREFLERGMEGQRAMREFFDGERLRGTAPMMQFMEQREGMESRREIMELERRIDAKARELRRAEEDDKAALESELSDMLVEAFDLKMAAEREHAQRMQEELTKLQERLRTREQSRSDIIARRKRQLLGERNDLDW